MQGGRVKVIRLITIFVVSGLLIVSALVWIFTNGSFYRNRFLESFMGLLVIILVCTTVEACWKPWTSSSSSSSSSAPSFPSHGGSVSSSSTMDIPLVYSESPPAYEDVVRTTVYETSFSDFVEPRNESRLGAVASSTDSNGTTSSKSSSERTNDERGVSGDVLLRTQATHDDFQEVYIPRRFSPFFSEEGSVPNSPTTSRELQLAVDCLPTYEEAVGSLQLHSRDPSGSDASVQNSDLILFM
ncbi:uncharacterized protein LOC135212105 [Macrobrachium nipponense]|uniref:uncharacterized protein LOC135212105 n=1 Tax=Macrobrachium nipponense TaxID=159736 RepID=UPI0030C7AAD3